MYLGGGYPELYVTEISSNRDFLEGLRNMASEGKPMLGECGGLMTMCKNLVDANGAKHPMSGIFGCDSVFVNKRHGPTYVKADALPGNRCSAGACRRTSTITPRSWPPRRIPSDST